MSFEKDPAFPAPANAVVLATEYYFQVYESIGGYNTTIYREPTALSLNFAISERAQPLGGKLILDFSKETRKSLATVDLSCETDLETAEGVTCEFKEGRLITNLKTTAVKNKTSYSFKIKGQ